MCIHGELGSFLTYIKSHIQRQNLCKVSLGNVSIIIVFCLQTELKAADYHLMFKFPLCACEDVCECVECVHEYMCKWVCVWAYVWVTVWVCCVCAVWVCKWVSVCVTCAQVPTETRKGHQIPLELLQANMSSLTWVLGTNLRSSGRAQNKYLLNQLTNTRTTILCTLCQSFIPHLLLLCSLFTFNETMLKSENKETNGCRNYHLDRNNCYQCCHLGNSWHGMQLVKRDSGNIYYDL